MATRYEVSVWNNMDGDHVKKLWEATDDDIDSLREEYSDPWHDVVIDREFEVEDEE